MTDAFIDFETINKCFTLSKNIVDENFFLLTNKDYRKLLCSLDNVIDKHTLEHFKIFCNYVVVKLNSYKNQDKHKYKGDYKSHVIKKGHEIECDDDDHDDYDDIKVIEKTIHTNAYNYISSQLYEDTYFNLVRVLELILKSNGMCFYCNCELSFEPSNTFMICNFERSCKYNLINHFQTSPTKYSLHSLGNYNKWSLERINNTLGHYQSNCVVACLKCNITRRRKNHQHFKFTKNLVIEKND